MVLPSLLRPLSKIFKELKDKHIFDEQQNRQKFINLNSNSAKSQQQLPQGALYCKV